MNEGATSAEAATLMMARAMRKRILGRVPHRFESAARVHYSLCFVAALFAGCSHQSGACRTVEARYADANREYLAGNYEGSSRLYESISEATQECGASNDALTPKLREGIALGLILAAEAAHRGRNDVRARKLARVAQDRLLDLRSVAKEDSEANAVLTADLREVRSDLDGTWTVGLPR